ncbi:hypothetical protein BDN72DRAFT_846636 [Pluteus cervinus]|uniref:Uncharacterized protein n=1 Tax=Pluteus cervinus TaxID=181527 RepID=A0ACD3AF66_9AGAR|nr:hypothetical protein BDN72DRAFT_846636 [Pluteus cervinus]
MPSSKELVNARSVRAMGHDVSPALPSPDLPTELMSIILEDLKPVFARTTEDNPHRPFREATHTLAQLALINKSWHHCVAPILYSTYLISTGDHDIERRVQGIKHHPYLIRTVIVHGRPGCNEAVLPKTLPHYLTSCLVECPNLQRLEIIEPQNVFGLLSKSATEKIFRSSGSALIHTLCLRSHTYQSLDKFLPYAFRMMGDIMKELRELEIFGGYTSLKPTYFAFPRELPCLESLSTTALHPNALRKILSRTGRRKKARRGVEGSDCAGPSHPLKRLSLCWHGKDDWLLDSLSINNLSSYLTSLRLLGHGTSYLFDDAVDGRPLRILRLCPQLKEFVFFCHSTTTYLQHLPSTLEILGVYLINSDRAKVDTQLTSPAQLLPLVNTQNKRRNIKKLVVGWEAWERPTSMMGVIELLEEACQSVGVQIEFQYSQEMRTKFN